MSVPSATPSLGTPTWAAPLSREEAAEGAPAPAEPREGLSPCWRKIAQFDGRQVTWHDESRCPEGDMVSRWTHVVCAGVDDDKIVGFFDMPGDCSGGRLSDGYGPAFVEVCTDDPDEAQAGFECGAEYVRTGEMPSPASRIGEGG